MLYVREFELAEQDGVVAAIPFGLDGGTQGDDFDDAVAMAADWLRLTVLDALERGETLPQGRMGNEPRHGGKVIALAVDVEASEATRDDA